MKKVNNLSKVLCALGVSTVLIAGVASAASTYPAPSSWNGVGSVASPMQSSEIDYVGAVTTLHRYYPDAMVTSISYDAKHHPTYEVEAYTKTQKVEMKIDEATGQVTIRAVVPNPVIKINGGNGNMPCKCATTGATQAITRPFFHP